MDKKLILIGGGGHCKSVIDVAESAGWSIAGILDTHEKVDEKVLGYSVLGTDDMISQFANDHLFIITVGHIKNADLRIKLHEKVFKAGGKLAVIIAQDAHVSPHAVVGEGSVIMHKAVVNADAKIGKGCIINTMSNIEHDAIIGDYCHISTGAMINGNCVVGDHIFVGSGTVLSNGISITANCVIAAGSIVRKNISENGIYAGNPAIKYK